MHGRRARPAAAAIGSTRGDPTNVDLAGATAEGIPVLRAPGRNADGVAELTVGLLLAVTRHLAAPPTATCATGEVYRDGTIPYQRFRAWQLAGRTAGLVGLGAVGPGHRAGGSRASACGCIAYDPFAADATHALDDLLAEADVVSMHAAVTPDTLGLMGAEQFAAHAARARSTSTRPGPPCTTSTRSTAALRVGPPRPAPASTTSRASTSPTDHPLVAMDQRRAHAAHRRRHLRHRGQPHHADRRRTSPRCSRGERPGQPAPTRRCSPWLTPIDVADRPRRRGRCSPRPRRCCADGLVEGTAGNVSGRLADGTRVPHAVVARLRRR